MIQLPYDFTWKYILIPHIMLSLIHISYVILLVRSERVFCVASGTWIPAAHQGFPGVKIVNLGGDGDGAGGRVLPHALARLGDCLLYTSVVNHEQQCELQYQ